MFKRLIIANDLAGLGKVAMSTSLPILASCQIETMLLPTVILSSHTGGFQEVFREDYSHATPFFLKQWKSIGIAVDGLVVGYCQSVEQLNELSRYAIEQQIPLIVDPIMGDKGEFYSGFNQDYAVAMRELASKAEVLIPNLTEAALLTNHPFLEQYSKKEVNELLWDLARLGAEHIVITGVSFDSKRIGVAYLNVEQSEITYHMGQHYPAHFFGSGDIMTTLIAAAYVENISLLDAFPLILDFLDSSLQCTLSLGRDVKYGICFEPFLADLSQKFQLLREKKGEKYESDKIT